MSESTHTSAADGVNWYQRCMTAEKTLRFAQNDLATLRAELERVNEELNETNAVFDHQWAADQRAIKRWQAAHPDRATVWPDRTDMVTWLIERWDTAEAQVAALKGDIRFLTGQAERHNIAMCQAQDRRDAAEAQVAELRAALEACGYPNWAGRKHCFCPDDQRPYSIEDHAPWCNRADAALARTPAEALERQRRMQAVVDAVGPYLDRLMHWDGSPSFRLSDPNEINHRRDVLIRAWNEYRLREPQSD